MDYSVFVGADGASVEQVERARLLYRETLNRGLGDAGQAKPCFIAYSKGKDGHPLSPVEDAQSGAWIRAEHAAREQAALILPDPASAVFTFRLNG
jgi:acyl-homoserine lactone acylase PvdQ